MKEFEFYNPVKIIFGAGKFAGLGTEAAVYGKRVLLVKTAGPLEKLGIYEKAVSYLKAAGMEVFELGGVAANPKVTSVREGVKICKDKKIEVVVAVGGGSGIDCAKAIGVGAMYDDDIWDFFLGKKAATKSLPVGAVSTLAATGAERGTVPHKEGRIGTDLGGEFLDLGAGQVEIPKAREADEDGRGVG